MIKSDKWFGPIKTFTLTNEKGIRVVLSNYGARLLDIEVPVGDERRRTVVSLPNFEDNIKDSYFGSIVGRVAGRISGGSAIIDGTRYFFDKNEGENTSHSGRSNFSNRVWNVRKLSENEIVFSLFSSDRDGGFPGNLVTYTQYTLQDDSTLTVTIKAKTDATTLFNPTNHVYFNLNGNGQQSVGNHHLKITSEKVILLNEDNTPQKTVAVKGTLFDLQKRKKLSSVLNSSDPQIKINHGLNHPFILKKSEGPQVILTSGDEKLQLEMTTTQSSIVVYTTGSYQEGYQTNMGKLEFAGGIALETQKPPGFEKERGENIFLMPDKEFKSETCFTFKTLER